MSPSAQSEVTRGEIKKLRAVEAIRRGKAKKLVWVIGLLLLVAGIVVGSIAYSRYRDRVIPGDTYPDEGQQHVSLTYQFDYSSNPPSSGPHYGSPAQWGVYDYEVNDKLFIHNLEHGGVWIAYRPTIAVEAFGELKSFVDEFGGSKLVMAPRTANDRDVALTAWTRVFKFDIHDGRISDEQKEQMRTFYRSTKNRGPELVPDTMPGIDPKSVQ
mgnify:FL=1